MSGATYSVRYIGIDAPESSDLFYEDAKKLNEDLVHGKSLRLEKDVSDKDDFGRLLRHVYAGDVLVSDELTKAGMARAASYPPDTRYATRFKQLETEAANSGRGIWSRPQITTIFYDGLVPRVESDEYVEISNFSGKTFDMTGWKLKDSDNHYFIFPKYSLDTNKTIRIYTNELHTEYGGFSFKSTTAIWNNSEDTAVLYDNQGKSVSRMRYRIAK